MKRKKKDVELDSSTLLAMVLSAASAARLRVADSAMADLEYTVRSGLRQMDEEGVLADADRRERAMRNMKLLASQLTEEARAPGQRILRRSALRRVFDKICPLWPFC